MIRHLPFIAAFLLATPAFGLVIDDFSVGDVTVEVDYSNMANSVIQTGLDTNHVIGGRRFVGLSLDLGQPGDTGSAIVDTTTQTLHLQANTPGGFETYGVGWAASSDPGTSLNADLLTDGADAFQIDAVAVSGPSGVGFRFSVQSGFDEGATVRNSSNVLLLTSDSPYSVRVPFSLFPDVDFTDIDYIAFDGRGAFSLTLHAIRTVPEPTTFLLSAIALLGLLCRRRKRR